MHTSLCAFLHLKNDWTFIIFGAWEEYLHTRSSNISLKAIDAHKPFKHRAQSQLRNIKITSSITTSGVKCIYSVVVIMRAIEEWSCFFNQPWNSIEDTSYFQFDKPYEYSSTFSNRVSEDPTGGTRYFFKSKLPPSVIKADPIHKQRISIQCDLRVFRLWIINRDV